MTDKKPQKNGAAAALRLMGGWVWVATRLATRVLVRGAIAAARGFGKLVLTIWRMAAALDSALWRATKLLAGKALEGAIYAGGVLAVAFRGLLVWLPTRTGRAYSSIAGVFLVIFSLATVDELRSSSNVAASNTAAQRPPIDEDDPILARIEGRYVHLSEIEAAARAGGFLRPGEVLTPETAFSRALVESYVEQRLLARAALEDGLQRTPAVSRRVNAARDRVLAASLVDRRIQEAVTPETVERLYAAQAGVTALGDEVRARHIVVASEDEAKEVLELLEGGAEFGALAREKSLDRATSSLGGEVGWFTHAMMTPTFADAAFSVSKGELAAPFASEFGWHVLEVTDRRPTQAVSIADVRGGIERFLRMRTIDTLLRELEEANQVIYFRPETEQSAETALPPDLTPPPLREGDDGVADTPLN